MNIFQKCILCKLNLTAILLIGCCSLTVLLVSAQCLLKTFRQLLMSQHFLPISSAFCLAKNLSVLAVFFLVLFWIIKVGETNDLALAQIYCDGTRLTTNKCVHFCPIFPSKMLPLFKSHIISLPYDTLNYASSSAGICEYC